MANFDPNKPNPGAETPDAQEASSSSRRRLRPVLKLCAVVISFSTVLFLALRGGDLLQSAKNVYARSLARRCEPLIEAQSWEAAAQMLSTAFQWAPREPEVLRAMAKFYRLTNSDPVSQSQFLRQLIDAGLAAPEDVVHYGSALLSSGDLEGARKSLALLPPAKRDGKDGLELLARILAEEGKTEEGAAMMRRALQADPDDRMSRLRLAVLDTELPFEESRRGAQEVIWSLAKGKDDVALRAIVVLAASKDLTTEQAKDLLALVKDHPEAKDSHRFAVLSAHLRLFPADRETILRTEMDRSEGKGVEDIADLLRWLSGEGQHQRILALVPKTMASRAQGVFPIYAEALKAESRWAELRDLIQSPNPPPISQSAAYVLLAECNAKLDRTLLQTRQNLVNALRNLEGSRDTQMMGRAARVAEANGMWDLAVQGYEMVAARDTQVKIQAMEKVLEIQTLQRDAGAMLVTAKKILQRRPTVAVLRDRADYLALLIGAEVEASAMRLLQTPPGAASDPSDRYPSPLLRALAAYRLGDLPRANTEIGALQRPDKLLPGPRAVAAGLLHLSGARDTAFRLAESTDRRLLLDPELKFLSLTAN